MHMAPRKRKKENKYALFDPGQEELSILSELFLS